VELGGGSRLVVGGGSSLWVELGGGSRLVVILVVTLGGGSRLVVVGGSSLRVELGGGSRRGELIGTSRGVEVDGCWDVRVVGVGRPGSLPRGDDGSPQEIPRHDV